MALKSDKSKSIIKEKKAPKSVAVKNEDKKSVSKKSVKTVEKPKQTVKSDTKLAKSPEKKATVKKSTAAKAPLKKELKAKPDTAPKKVKSATAKASSEDLNFDLEKSTSVNEGKAIKTGKFDIRRAKDGRFFFCLYASNYAVVAYSQIYSSSAKAIVGINSVIANCPKAPIEDSTLKKQVDLPFPKWEIYIDNAGEYRFRLYATNGLCVCHSAHGYSTKSGCKGGIESIKRFSQEAIVDKSYLD